MAGCGSKQSLDPEGFTTAQRQAAQTALDRLSETSLARTVVAISYRSGQAPNTCTVIPVAGRDGAFRLVLAWQGLKPAYRSVPQSLLEATIGGASSRSVRFHVSSFGTTTPESASVKASLARAALAKPAAQCEVLQGGELQLVSPE